MRLAAFAALVLFAAACASASEEEGEAGGAPVSSLEQARAAIDLAIGDATASDPIQCQIIPVGVRPCGGPRLYLAYSLVVTDSAELRALVEVYDRLDRERNAELGLMSTCEFLEPPYAALDTGRCVTAPAH
ncbi:MAG: hypothetical protein ABL963_16960 [Longimicrobiales bacterium]